jgi:Ca2+/Na+ antiporter
MRGLDDVALGTLLGGHIFNCLWIVPVAALIHPIEIDRAEVAVAIGFGILAVAIVFPPGSCLMGRGRGCALLTLYAGYLDAMVLLLGLASFTITNHVPLTRYARRRF